ncbi:type III secretion protein [Burkholderia glumae]|uniref:type III secretion system protein SctP n=1 Tax=Burkholderia glumae TaxID=337 RepID=UPI000F601649|nr:type III secretion system protein SctP [Burkholderia glumae]MCM2551096.1 type III secretion system protein SctP [Burkholderia glumae]MCQ0033674.1 type III secretion system protein SctP [Burkholderia glumae]MCQ0040246.1 type III secretion system protein SctP [Burkholderia glumae]NVE25984.1 type III secretion system protein SctP [Burkholderia glumae]QGA39984.1 type III secretion protein [Burkholderia glumae]
MTAIDSRTARVIPGTAADEPGGARERRFDYASLAARRAPHRLPARGQPQQDGREAPDEEAGQAGIALYFDPRTAPDESAAAPPAPPAAPMPSVPPMSEDARDSLRSRVERAAVPVVSAVYMHQQQYLKVLGVLTREIAAFCGDPAIAGAGNWEAQMTLDPALLPHTRLALSLSRFSLRLRFDAQDPASRDLLLTHSTMLQRELADTLRAWGELRDIELTVW